MEAIVLDKDSTGKLWVTYTQGNQVYVNRSLGNDQSWGTPFVLPVQGTAVSADDISGIVAFDTSTAAPQIGVMWSNQIDSAMYFATHRDGDADDIWQASRTAIQGPNQADDHISLRSLQADDVSGRVFAAVKTSLNDVPNPNPNAPLNLLLVRGQDGSWTNNVFGRVGDDHTRPIVMIDREHRNLYMLATASTNGGTIYYKKSPLGNISFPTGKGTPFIQSTTDKRINNATSTKQNINSMTGLLVQASDDTSKNYLHNFMDLGDPDTVAPTISAVAPADETTGVAATSNAEATFSEAMNPATISGSTFTLTRLGDTQSLTAQVTYDAATKKATLDPNADLDPNTTYTATIKGGTSGVKDLAGNPLAQDKSWSFTTAALPQDTIPPETAIDSGPSGTVSGRTATFTFSSSEASSTFECKLDDANFVPCTSPKDYSELADGSHTFSVKAIDAANNVDSTPASSTWTVDTVAPNTTMDSKPATLTNSTSANFSFTSDESGSTFECSLDGVPFTACTSPRNLTDLSEGSHTFQVKATDAVGNVDASPESYTWTIDTTAPETTIDMGPSGTITVADATFAFSSSEPNSTFECSLDGAAYSACTSPENYTSLSNGSHTFEVKATDEASNLDATPASRTFSVEVTPRPPADTTPPETTIDSGPSGTVNSSSASFAFSSDEAGSTFECKLDTGTFASCTSPKAYGGLSNGSHTFEVRATDAAGNTDATPANRTWTVDTNATKVLTSVADTQIWENAPTTNYGATTPLGADGDEPTGTARDKSSLLKWSVSTIPAGSKISSASVTLNVTNSSTQTYQAFALKQPWAESAATWTLYAAGQPWQIAGANGSLDRDAQAAGTIRPATMGKQTFTLSPALVQSWLDNPQSNNGIIITNTSNTDGFDFSSREATTSSLRPQLDVTYAKPTTTDTTAPAVTKFASVACATDGSIATNVEATFSEAMDASTINSSTFTLVKQGASQPVAAEVSYDLATMKATLDPGGEILDLDSSATYIATIKGGANGAKDLAGNPLTEDESWSFTTAAAPPPADTTPPETTIDSGPSGTVTDSSVSFAFSSSEAGSTFECSLDGAAYSACTSPKGYTNLSNGSHTFEVRATDAAGNVDATPASRTFSVDVPAPPQDTTPPETTIDSGPSGTVKPKDATFMFHSSEAGSTFECKLDSGSYSACSSPKRYTGLANGSHTFLVRATDAAGNTDATPASRTWTVRR